jgi:hypothetical protein
MTEINSETSLREAILKLEGKRTVEGEMLKEQFFSTFESIKPLNMLKTGLREAASSHELKADILNSAVGLGAGFLSKVLFQRLTKNPVKRMLGTALMLGVARLVARNPETVQKLGRGIMKMAGGDRTKRTHPA